MNLLPLLLLVASVGAFAPPTGTPSSSALNAERKPFITGNWKLNPSTRSEAVQLATDIARAVGPNTPGDVALFVPFPFIEAVQKAVGDKVIVGAEVSPKPRGVSTTEFFLTRNRP